MQPKPRRPDVEIEHRQPYFLAIIIAVPIRTALHIETDGMRGPEIGLRLPASYQVPVSITDTVIPGEACHRGCPGGPASTCCMSQQGDGEPSPAMTA